MFPTVVTEHDVLLAARLLAAGLPRTTADMPPPNRTREKGRRFALLAGSAAQFSGQRP